MLKTDWNLLTRVIKILRDEAKLEHLAYGNDWGSADGRVAKRRHDRLLREANDLEQMRWRLKVRPAAPPQAMEP